MWKWWIGKIDQSRINNQSIIPSTDVIQLTLTLKMTTAQVVEAQVTVNNNSPIQDYVHPDDQTQPTFEMTPGFKPFTAIFSFPDINATLGMLPSRRHEMWRDSVSVGVKCHGSKSDWGGIFQHSFSVCCAVLMSHKNDEIAVYGYNPALFWVLSVSCWCLVKLIFTYCQLSPCGHPAITDTPIIGTAAKSLEKINNRRLTEINSCYYRLLLMRTLTRSLYSVCNKGSWLYYDQIQSTPFIADSVGTSS